MLIPFVKLACGTGEIPAVPLDERQWEMLCDEAQRQALSGVIGSVVLSLPVGMLPPHRQKIVFAYCVEDIRDRNEMQNQKIIDIVSMMQDLGLECCLLKGQGIARYYPNPETRQSGDIDLWVKGPLKRTVKILKARWDVRNVFYHHTAIRPKGFPMEVEVHFRPTWMNDPFTNRKLQGYFFSREDELFRNVGEGGYPTPDIEFNLVFCAVHIYRHLLFEGIGLRQVMDYFFLLRHSSEEERDSAYGILRQLKMERFTGALMFVLQEFFGMEEGLFLCTPDSKRGLFFCSEILRSGNFGQYDERNVLRSTDSVFRRGTHRMGRIVRFFGIAPYEVFWAPFFKIWQYLWRRV